MIGRLGPDHFVDLIGDLVFARGFDKLTPKEKYAFEEVVLLGASQSKVARDERCSQPCVAQRPARARRKLGFDRKSLERQARLDARRTEAVAA